MRKCHSVMFMNALWSYELFHGSNLTRTSLYWIGLPEAALILLVDREETGGV